MFFLLACWQPFLIGWRHALFSHLSSPLKMERDTLECVKKARRGRRRRRSPQKISKGLLISTQKKNVCTAQDSTQEIAKMWVSHNWFPALSPAVKWQNDRPHSWRLTMLLVCWKQIEQKVSRLGWLDLAPQRRMRRNSFKKGATFQSRLPYSSYTEVFDANTYNRWILMNFFFFIYTF